MATGSLRLHTFGGLWLEAEAGPRVDAASQKRRLALLALVAASGSAGVSRDKVLAYLWPARDTDHARHSLAQLVYAMRHAFEHQLISGEAEFRLDSHNLSSDIGEFLPTAQPAELDALYAGPFLDGFYLKDAPEFERWTSRERERTTAMAAGAIEAIARNAAAMGNYAGAIASWRRRVSMSPLDSGPAMELMDALASSGDRLGACRYATHYENLVRTEEEQDPDPLVRQLAEQIRRKAHVSALQHKGPEPADTPVAPPPTVNSDPESPVTAVHRPRLHADLRNLGQPPQPRPERRLDAVLAGIAGLAVIAVVVGLWTNKPRR